MLLQLLANSLGNGDDAPVTAARKHEPVAPGHPQICRIEQPVVIAGPPLFRQRSPVNRMNDTNVARQRIAMTQHHA
jgi:hypothetical protein